MRRLRRVRRRVLHLAVVRREGIVRGLGEETATARNLQDQILADRRYNRCVRILAEEIVHNLRGQIRAIVRSHRDRVRGRDLRRVLLFVRAVRRSGDARRRRVRRMDGVRAIARGCTATMGGIWLTSTWRRGRGLS